MLLYQIYDVDYTPKYTLFQLRISTIRGWLADRACLTVVRTYQFDLSTVTDVCIKDKEFRV